MAGFTGEGLSIKRLTDIQSSMKTNAAEIFGDLIDPNDVVDTSSSTAIGRIIGLTSAELALIWETIQGVYWAYSPETATGVALDNIVLQSGITRRGELATTADIYIEGNRGGTITRGMNVRSHTSGNLYSVNETITLVPENCFGVGVILSQPTVDGTYKITYKLSHQAVAQEILAPMLSTDTAEVGLEKIRLEISNNHPLLSAYFKGNILFIVSDIDFQMSEYSVNSPLEITKVISSTNVRGLETGAVPEAAGDINRISTPSLVWDEVWNPFPASIGSSRESDEQLRLRFRDTKFQRASNIIEALYTGLYSLEGVKEVSIIENDTGVIDLYGNPPHSFLVIVEGGLNTSIAREIWRNRPVGIQSNGDISINILDSFGFLREVRFSRPEYPKIQIQLSITKGIDFPTNGEDDIRTALVDYILNHGIGDDIFYSRLYTPINSVQGHQVNSLEIGKEGGAIGTSNIVIDYNEKPIISKENIVFI